MVARFPDAPWEPRHGPRRGGRPSRRARSRSRRGGRRSARGTPPAGRPWPGSRTALPSRAELGLAGPGNQARAPQREGSLAPRRGPRAMIPRAGDRWHLQQGELLPGPRRSPGAQVPQSLLARAGRRIARQAARGGADAGDIRARHRRPTSPPGPARSETPGPARNGARPPGRSRTGPDLRGGPGPGPHRHPGPAWDEPHPRPGTNPDGDPFLCAGACARRKYRANRKPFPIGPNTLTGDEKSTGLCSGFSSGF